MKVLVAVKRVVDYNVKVRPNGDGSDVEIANAKMSMNPFDEIAVEEAVRMKEAGTATEAVAISLGEAACQDVVRTALAMGMDRGVLVETDERLEPLTVAKLLAAIVKREQFDLVILGKQAIDDDSNQTGQMLAALLGWPQGTFASHVAVDDDRVQVTRETDTGSQTLSFQLPGVVTSDLRLNEPRYVKLPNIMKAKKKPLEKITPMELDVDISTHLAIIAVAEPTQRSGGIKVADAKELVEKLRNEARVI